MSKFKVGDKVRRIKNHSNDPVFFADKNEIFIVVKITDYGDIYLNKDCTRGWMGNYFELASPEKKKEKRWIAGGQVFYDLETAKRWILGFADCKILEVEILAEYVLTTVSTTTWTRKEL